MVGWKNYEQIDGCNKLKKNKKETNWNVEEEEPEEEGDLK